MQILYQSDQFVVVGFDDGEGAAAPARRTGGLEIVDKPARREIYIEGAVADAFRQGVAALAEAESDAEAYDDFIAGYTVLAQQPLVLH
mgnify:FL=1